jgi:phospholipid/cholesterol/gamma-HCH transport system permease protein
MVSFIGEAVLSWAAWSWARRASGGSVAAHQECGAQALDMTLISFLIGLILAFMGAMQLRQFGAVIYTADLVGLGMTREMGQ